MSRYLESNLEIVEHIGAVNKLLLAAIVLNDAMVDCFYPHPKNDNLAFDVMYDARQKVYAELKASL